MECGGAFIPADHIRFEETVARAGKRCGNRTVIAEVIEAEGPEADDWVCLLGLRAQGDFPAEVEGQFRRRRKSIERNGVARRLWGDESARATLVDGTNDHQRAAAP